MKSNKVIWLACLLLLAVATEALAEGQAWVRKGYDLARTHYYPYGSSYEISFDDFSTLWVDSFAAEVVLTGDINGDGKLEIAAWSGATLSVYDSEGYELWSVTESGTRFTAPALLDVTGDAVVEVTWGQRSNAGELQILVYDGTGNLINTLSRPGGGSSIAIWPHMAADFDGDGNIEISANVDAGYALQPRGVSLFDYTTSSELWYYAVGGTGGVAYGDFNEDGQIEAVRDIHTVHNGVTGCGVNGQATCTDDSRIATVALSAGTGQEVFTRFYGHGHGDINHAIVDLNQDGDYNILGFWGHTTTYPGVMQLYLLDALGNTINTWNGAQNKLVPSQRWAIADVDNDGRQEVIFCEHLQGPGLGYKDFVLRIVDDDLSVQVAVNDTLVDVDNNDITLHVSDLNGDGSNDILVSDKLSGKLRVLDGSLNEVWSFDAPHIREIALSDLNGDGIPEIILAGDSLIVLSAPVPLITASLDIKPGSCPNPLNVKHHDDDNGEDSWVKDGDNTMAAKERDHHQKKKKAVLPVAILGTEDFDVSLIEPTTVTLEGIPAIRWEVEDEAAPVVDPTDSCDCTEDEEDGYLDLEMKFNKKDLIEALGEVYDGQLIPLTITGELYDGTPFEGTDCVLIRKHDDDEEDDSSGGGGNVVFPAGILKGNYPNPFNPVTEISFSLPGASDVKLEIYNVMGQRVATIVDGFMEAGTHTARWDAGGFSSGVYFYKLQAGEFEETRKMVLLK